MDKLEHPINLDHITPEQAIQGTIEMWSDMANTLGEKPNYSSRNTYKKNWITLNGYGSIYPGMTRVTSDCFLCECAGIEWRKSGYSKTRCDHCPIYWPDDTIHPRTKCVSDSLDYRLSPLPDILGYLKDKKNRREP